MIVLVDTPVWSLAYRRHKVTAGEKRIVEELKQCVRSHQVVMIGSIRQEVLSGISNFDHWDVLRTTLRAFDNLPLAVEDFEMAARFFNQCRATGIQGSQIDFLICAVSQRFNAPVFTTDGDFTNYAQHIDIDLYNPDQVS